MDVDTARASGMLLAPLPQGQPAYFQTLDGVRWDAILSQWTSFVALAGVAVLISALNSAALDLDAQGDVDFDHELRANGLASLLGGLAGGMAGTLSLSRTVLNRRAGARSRLAGLWSAVVCLAAMYLFPSLLAFLPTPLLGGLLVFLGLAILRDWLWKSFFRLPHGEFLVVAMITLVIVFYGVVAGVGVGLIAATMLFVYHLGRTRTIRTLVAGSSVASNRERTTEETAILNQRGDAVRFLCLQGYIFFGTSSSIVQQCRQFVEREAVSYIGLDFRLVQGIDVSSVAAFAKLALVCDRAGATLLFSDVSSNLHDLLESNRHLSSQRRNTFEDLDRAMEWIEDQLLLEARGVAPNVELDTAPLIPSTPIDINELLEEHFTDDAARRLREYCEAQRLEPGEALIRQGEPGEELFIIEEGLVSVLLRGKDGRVTRLRTFGPGTIVGEMALYTSLTRSADVVADIPCRVWLLPVKHLRRMERMDPDLAIQFHVFIVNTLASRLGAANRAIQAFR
jgi:SulP family sulfate permease